MLEGSGNFREGEAAGGSWSLRMCVSKPGLPASSLLPVHQEMKKFFCHRLCCYDLLCFRAKRLRMEPSETMSQRNPPPPYIVFPDVLATGLDEQL